jgi:hypothetical protein
MGEDPDRWIREIQDVVKAPVGTPDDVLRQGITVGRRWVLVGRQELGDDGDFYELHVIVEFDSLQTGWVVFVEQVFGTYRAVPDVT